MELTLIHGWGGTEADHVAMRGIYEEFEAKHPHIRLNLLSMPSSDDVVTMVKDMLTVGEVPDLVFTGGLGKDTIYDFMVKEGYAVDLMPYLQEDESFRKNVSESILSYWTEEDGGLYTVSDVLLLAGYWYNEEIFAQAGIEAPPATWPQFLEACRKLRDWSLKEEAGVYPLILDSDHMMYLTDSMLAETMPEALDEIKDGRLNVDDPGFVRMLEQMRQLYAYVEIADHYSYRDTLENFNKEKTAIYINGVWAATMIDQDLEVKYAAFPHEDGTGVTSVSSCVGYILGQSADSRKIEAGVEFIKYMLSEPVAGKILAQTGQIPSNPAGTLEAEMGNSRLHQAVNCVRSAGHQVEIPENIWNSALRKKYEDALSLYMEGQISLEAFQQRMKKGK